MTADRLRRVAAEMREYAEAATPGPWWDIKAPGRSQKDVDGDWVVDSPGSFVCSTQIHTERGQSDARHIAAWSPPVALAVAEWLEDEAKTASRQLNAWPVSPHALVVCDAWEQGR